LNNARLVYHFVFGLSSVSAGEKRGFCKNVFLSRGRAEGKAGEVPAKGASRSSPPGRNRLRIWKVLRPPLHNFNIVKIRGNYNKYGWS
jgi:hypothetical protein